MTDALDAHALATVRAEFLRLRALGDRALAQVPDDASFHARLDEIEANSLAIIVRHVAGNMRSRWTDFLTSDGEKPWRDRDVEFDLERRESRAELMAAWEDGWNTTLAAITALGPSDLMRTVPIRGERLTVYEALLRQLAHYAAHTGQIVMLAKHIAGPRWQTLTIPRGRSKEATGGYRRFGQL
jgi:hypothetical protein